MQEADNKRKLDFASSVLGGVVLVGRGELVRQIDEGEAETCGLTSAGKCIGLPAYIMQFDDVSDAAI